METSSNVSACGIDEVVGVKSDEDTGRGGKEQYEEERYDARFKNDGKDGDKDNVSVVPSFCDDDCSTIAASNLTRTQQQHGEEEEDQQQQQWQSPQRLLEQQRIQEEEEQFESRLPRRSNVGVLITYGMEQWASVPALLLLCPFAGLMTILIFLSEEDWNWKTCLVSRNVLRIVYGFQCAAFSSMIFFALEVHWLYLSFTFSPIIEHHHGSNLTKHSIDFFLLLYLPLPKPKVCGGSYCI
jgi:hypothetical protein